MTVIYKLTKISYFSQPVFKYLGDVFIFLISLEHLTLYTNKMVNGGFPELMHHCNLILLHLVNYLVLCEILPVW